MVAGVCLAVHAFDPAAAVTPVHDAGGRRLSAVLVDLRTGRAVGPEGVFLPNSNWLREVTRIVSAGISTPNLTDLLKQPRRYVFLGGTGRL